MLFCGKCEKKGCTIGERDHMPSACPSLDLDIQEDIKALYAEEENRKIAYNSALVEAEGYCNQTRLMETISFMKKCGYKKIGLAFCMGLKKEAKILVNILEYHGFEVVSVICKTGSVPKSFIGVTNEQKIPGQKDAIMCNPIGQAKLLNRENVDFTILFGLCVGHDTLAIKYLDSPVTVLVVKDRVLCHNPIAAIYQSEAYYRKKIYSSKERG